MANRYEEAARARKVAALFQVARRNRISALSVADSTDIRSALVTLAGVREPSLESWKALVRALASAEAQDDRYRGAA